MKQTKVGEAAEFIIGAEVTGSDGVLGELTGVVVDPIASAITQLVSVTHIDGLPEVCVGEFE